MVLLLEVPPVALYFVSETGFWRGTPLLEFVAVEENCTLRGSFSVGEWSGECVLLDADE